MGCMCGRFAVTTDPALLAEKIKAIDESTVTTDAKDPPQPKPRSGAAYGAGGAEVPREQVQAGMIKYLDAMHEPA